MSRSVFIVIGVLVTLVIILSGLVGFFYGQSEAQKITIIETMTKIYTETVTVTKTVSFTQVTTITIPTLTDTFTRYEKLEIASAYAQAGTNGWEIRIFVKNTGSSDVTVTEVFVNGKPASVAGLSGTTNFTLNVGASTSLTYTLTGPYGSGQTIEIKLHTASGAEYPKAVVLP